MWRRFGRSPHFLSSGQNQALGEYLLSHGGTGTRNLRLSLSDEWGRWQRWFPLFRQRCLNASLCCKWKWKSPQRQKETWRLKGMGKTLPGCNLPLRQDFQGLAAKDEKSIALIMNRHYCGGDWFLSSSRWREGVHIYRQWMSFFLKFDWWVCGFVGWKSALRAGVT